MQLKSREGSTHTKPRTFFPWLGVLTGVLILSECAADNFILKMLRERYSSLVLHMCKKVVDTESQSRVQWSRPSR